MLEAFCVSVTPNAPFAAMASPVVPDEKVKSLVSLFVSKPMKRYKQLILLP